LDFLSDFLSQDWFQNK